MGSRAVAAAGIALVVVLLTAPILPGSSSIEVQRLGGPRATVSDALPSPVVASHEWAPNVGLGATSLERLGAQASSLLDRATQSAASLRCPAPPLVASCAGTPSFAPSAAASSSAWVNRTFPEFLGDGVGALELQPSVAYDPASQQLLRVGGALGGPSPQPLITWGFSDGLWSNLTGPVAPTGRAGATMGWDYSDGYMVLFGGASLSPSGFAVLSDTWTYSNAGWTPVSWSPQPAGRFYASMVWDPAIDGFLLFGGANTTTLLNDTWELQGGAWTEVASPVSPSAREGASIAWDAADDAVLLFGGTDNTSASGSALNDTWSFSAGAWTPVHTAHTPPGRIFGAMTNDSADSAVVLVGGTNQTNHFLTDTWTFSGGDWHSASPARSPTDLYGGAAFDPAVNAVLLWTANYTTGPNLPDLGGQTWAFSAGQWTELSRVFLPGANGVPGLVWDSTAPGPTPGAMFEFGGANGTQVVNETWAARGELWQELYPATAPSPRAGGTLVDDPALDGVLLFGGSNSTTVFNETWLFRGGSWTLLPEPVHPSARVSAAGAYDPTLGQVLLFGGNNLTADFNDSWILLGNGSWTPAPTAGGPAPRTDSAMTFDPSLGEPILFGGTNFTFSGTGWVVYNDTWGFHGGTWAELPLVTTPTAREAAGLADDPAAGSVVLFGGETTTAVLNDTWELGPGGWQRVATVGAPPTLFYPGLAYDPQFQVLREFGGAHPVGSSTGLELVGYEYAFDPLTVTTSSSSSAGSAPLSVQFRTDVTGGTGPLSFSWSFGDGGTSSVANASHVYYANGSFLASLTVTDGFGVNTTVTTPETVTGPSVTPLSTSLTATPTSGAAPLSVTFGGTAQGGVAPYRATWTFGDGGNATGLSAAHTFLTAGNSTVVLTVNDSVGGTSTSSTVIRVSAGSSSPPLPLVAHVALNRASGTAGIAIAFSASASGGVPPYTFAWAFGDGATGAGAAVDHAYARAENFTANVTVRDAAGDSTSTSVLVNVTVPTCACGPRAPGGSSPNLPAWVLPSALVVAGAAAAIAAALLVRRKRRAPPPRPESAGSSSAAAEWSEGPGAEPGQGPG